MRARQPDPARHALSGWLLALSSTALAITAHGLAGGGQGDAALLIPLTALLAWVASALATRLRRMVVLVPVLGVIQLGLHLLLSQSAGTHLHGGTRAPAVSGWAMLAGHAIAVVVIAALLASAAGPLAVISSAIDRLRGQLAALRIAPVPAAAGTSGDTARASATAPRPGLLLEVLLRRVSARRGPPARS